MPRLLLEEQSAIFKDSRVLDLAAFSNIPLRGGFSIVEVRLTAQSLLDPLGRPAAAQTLIRGSKFFIVLREGTDEEDLSVSLYHEVLEAATVAAENPPESVMEFNEGDFEESARSAHARYGIASPTTLNEMLEKFGFDGQIHTMKRSIEMLLLKLADGGRVLRFYEPSSGLCLEKRLEPDKSVAQQKKRWEKVFANMLERELGVAA